MQSLNFNQYFLINYFNFIEFSDRDRIENEATIASLKYPPIPNFLTKKGFRSILVLQNHELRKLARLGGISTVSGFNASSKSDTSVWPYPCSHPFFKTCWLFRTLNAQSLATIAHQLRILWTCLRWDDMTTEPTSDGKIVEETDAGIVSMVILNTRIRGRFSERTEYLRSTLLTPYDYKDRQSKSVEVYTSKNNTPRRSGLRKRNDQKLHRKSKKNNGLMRMNWIYGKSNYLRKM